jgi:hypothetical protein
MSTIWTPGGEVPVPPREPREQREPPLTSTDSTTARAKPADADPEEVARLKELTKQLAQTPASVVVTNHAMGLFELAALHLSQKPPNLPHAQLAIDAMGCLVEGLAGRLDDNEQVLKDALAQIRLAYVQLKKTSAGSPPPPES